jgi:chitodextrinase
MHRPLPILLIIALVGASLGVATLVEPQPAEAALADAPFHLPFSPSLFDPEPVIGGGVEGFTVSSVPGQNWRVHAFAQIGARIFVGGAFTTVSERPWAGSPTHDQPYLAAFALDTNDWIPDFAPDLDDAVWALAVHDGQLLVGGEFDTVNGVAREGLVALDPETGSVVDSFVAYIDNVGSGYEPSVRALEVVGDDLYVAGDFNRLVQPPWSHGVYRIGRVDAGSGVLDKSWYPRVTGGGVFDITVDPARNEAVLVGSFTSVNASASTLSGAVVDLTEGATVAGHLMSTNGDFDETYGAAQSGGRYWLGGEQRYLQVRDAGDWGYLGCFGGGNYSGPTCTDRSPTPSPRGGGRNGGDFQVVEEIDGYIVAGGHVQWHLWSSFDSSWTLMSDLGGTRVMSTTGGQVDFLANLPYWTEGPYAVMADTNGCLYIGGDFVGNVDGFGRMCPVLAPGNVTAADGSAVMLSWAEPAVDGSGIDHYEVSRDGAFLADVTDTTLLDADVVEGQTYSYTVVAVTGSGKRGPASEPAQGTADADADADLPPFGTPDNVVLTSNDIDTVTVEWDGVAGARGYLIHRDWLYQGYVTAGTTYVDTNDIEIGQTYRYQVRAQDDQGDNSPPTPIEMITVGADGPDVTAPSVPLNAAATTSGVDQVVLTWDPATDDRGVTGYLIHRDWQYLAYVSAGSEFIDNSVVAGQQHRYQVRAQDAAGNVSDPSDMVRITVEPDGGGEADVTPPGTPPGAVALLNEAGDAIDLTWDSAADNVGVAGYLIHRNWQFLAFVVAGTSYSDSGIEVATRYRYQVRAQDAAGNNSAPTELLVVDVP